MFQMQYAKFCVIIFLSFRLFVHIIHLSICCICGVVTVLFAYIKTGFLQNFCCEQNQFLRLSRTCAYF